MGMLAADGMIVAMINIHLGIDGQRVRDIWPRKIAQDADAVDGDFQMIVGIGFIGPMLDSQVTFDNLAAIRIGGCLQQVKFAVSGIDSRRRGAIFGIIGQMGLVGRIA